MSANIANETLRVEQTLQQAIAQHQTGQLQEAEQLYQTILKTDPNHPEANHNMGVLAVQRQQPAAGLPYFMAALNADPACGQYWLSAIDGLFQADQLEAAREVLGLALQQGLQGDEVEALMARMKGNEEAEQSNADYQHASRESQNILSTVPQNNSNNPSPQQINTLVALFNEGRYAEATTLAQTMTERFPRHKFGWKALGALFSQMGCTADALVPMQKAAALSPDDAEIHCNLGLTLHQLGRLDEAEASYRRALEIKPEFFEVHYNLGNTLHELGRLGEAKASYQRALQIMPNEAKALNSLSTTLMDLGQLDESEASCRRAVEISPDFIDAHNNLGYTLQQLGRLDEAEASYRRALDIKPDYAIAQFNLGCIFQKQGRLVEAELSHRRALEIKPDFVEAYYNLGLTLNDLGRIDEAEASFRQALQIKPDYADVYNCLGCLLQKLGQLDEGIAYFRRALELKPDYAMAHSNLIFTLDLMPDKAPLSFLQAERKRWDVAHAAHLLHRYTHPNIPDPERRLRIGYVAADFRTNNTPSVFGAMLFNFDRSRFDVVAYSNSELNTNALSLRFQQSVTCWREISCLSDDEAADLIRRDEIDILVDLWGHSAGNRLLVFARKPAPIQITAWGYATGTGMQAMDVMFTDSVFVLPHERQFYTEQIRYLPCSFRYSPPQCLPAINVLPALSARSITFGSFNRLEKVSDESYQTWAQLLLAVPNSRMLMKTPELDDAKIREHVTEQFTRAGVAAERIVLQGGTLWEDHMAAFHQIDIALDPFPQGGGLTSLEGLIMGVPLVTLLLPYLTGRLGASILTALGLNDWIAETPEQYIEIARQKAQAVSALAELRQDLRTHLTSSIIGDADTYVRIVEQEYRKLWQEWCSRV